MEAQEQESVSADLKRLHMPPELVDELIEYYGLDQDE